MRRICVVALLILVLALNGCKLVREADPKLAGTYLCDKSSDRWQNPMMCVLFKKWQHTLELRPDGSIAITWSYGNPMRAQGRTELWQVIPETRTSQGEWWNVKDTIYVEIEDLDLALRGTYKPRTALTIGRTRAPWIVL